MKSTVKKRLKSIKTTILIISSHCTTTSSLRHDLFSIHKKREDKASLEISHSVSHVLSLFKVAAIYLHIAMSLHHFNLLCKVPLPNLGFSLVGFIAFHSFSFPKDSVTVTLLKTHSIAKALGARTAVSYLPDLIDSISTNTTIIADCASMDFPLA